MTASYWIGRLRHRAAAFAHDVLMIPVAWFGAFWLRFNLGDIPQAYLEQAISLLPTVMVGQSLVFWAIGLYRGVWRFASVPDLLRITKASAIGTVVILAAVLLFTRMENVPRSVFVLYAILVLLLLGGPRVVYRWFKDQRLYSNPGKRVLIVGAGRAGDLLVRDLQRDAKWNYQPIGFVDDEVRRRGREIHGVRVLGATKDIPVLVEKYTVEVIVIAIPSAGPRTMQRIVGICQQTGVPFRTLPRLRDAAPCGVSAQDLREVSIDDLLGREPVTLDWRAISDGLGGKTVVVTGGGGVDRVGAMSAGRTPRSFGAGGVREQRVQPVPG